MNTDHMTDAWIDSGQYCAQDVANLRDCITALQSRLEAAEGENGRLKEMKLPIPDGDWLGKFGDCKLCGGEIPYGHTDNCHIWKMEQKVTSLQSQLTAAESRAQQAEEMAGRVVEALKQFSRIDESWPIWGIIESLCDAVDFAFERYDMRPDGWESWSENSRLGRELATKMRVDIPEALSTSPPSDRTV
jgi:hypothetical protein